LRSAEDARVFSDTNSVTIRVDFRVELAGAFALAFSKFYF